MKSILNRLYVKYLIWKSLQEMVANGEIESDYKIVYDKTKRQYMVDINPIVKPKEIDCIEDAEVIEDIDKGTTE